MSHKRNEEHGRKFGETEIDGEAWLLGDPLKIGNIRGGRRKCSHTYTYYIIVGRNNNMDFKDNIKQYEYIRYSINFLTTGTNFFLCCCVFVLC
jgi:hypothetical protein